MRQHGGSKRGAGSTWVQNWVLFNKSGKTCDSALGGFSRRLPPGQQAATLATLSPCAVLSDRHLNRHGAYDFSDQPLPTEAPVDMDLIAA